MAAYELAISWKDFLSHADAFIYHVGQHPLEEMLNHQYGDACFLVRKSLFPNASKIVSIFRDEDVFDQAMRGCFWPFKSRSVLAYGSAKVLMMAEDKNEKYGKWRDLIADAFKDGYLFDRFGEEPPTIVNGFELHGRFVIEDSLVKRLKRV